ncbi:hypothetical protein BKI52_16280 [marine bacterium AO1-C]|nr:hypothetical protein BKI52_16280 [marine bacterium AO1-C]
MKTLLLVLYIWSPLNHAPTPVDTSRQEAQAETGNKLLGARKTKTTSSKISQSVERKWKEKANKKKTVFHPQRKRSSRSKDFGLTITGLIFTLFFFGIAFLLRLNVMPFLILGINLLLHLIIAIVLTIDTKRTIKKGENDIQVNSSELWFDWGMMLIGLSLFLIITSIFIFVNSTLAFNIFGSLALGYTIITFFGTLFG